MREPILLPPLPPHPETCHVWSDKQKAAILARDQQIVEATLAATAKVCDYWTTQQGVFVNGAIRCRMDIQQLEVKYVVSTN
jgi:hypothetical protein